MAAWIIEHMPQHKIYCEPFGGAASVLLAKPRSKAEIYNDLDGRIVHVFRIMQDRKKAEELKWRLRHTPYSRSEFNRAYDPPADDIDAARNVIIKAFMGTGANGAVRKGKTGFFLRVGAEGGCANAGAWPGYSDCIDAFCDRLQGVIIEDKDAIELMRANDREETLFYVDPPYMPETWHSQGGYAKALDADYHKRLLEAIKGFKGMVMLSGYENGLYAEELSGWKTFRKKTLNNRSAPRIECLWLNPSAARNSGARLLA